jgi:hypothetical protein
MLHVQYTVCTTGNGTVSIETFAVDHAIYNFTIVHVSVTSSTQLNYRGDIFREQTRRVPLEYGSIRSKVSTMGYSV